MAVLFYIPIMNIWEVQFVSIFSLTILKSVKVMYHHGFNLHSLMTYEVQHLFMWLLAIHISSSMKCLFMNIFCSFSNWTVFLLLSFEHSFLLFEFFFYCWVFVLFTPYWSDIIWFANNFSQSVACILFFLKKFLEKSNFLISMRLLI